MPIGEAHKVGSSFSGLCEYILAQGIYSSEANSKKPEIVFRNHVFASDYLELGREFRSQAKENSRLKKPVMHLTVNFKSSDQISDDNQKQFVKRIMQEMGISNDNHQYAVVKHNDKHPHYHVIVNRVGFDGITLSDSNSKLRIGTATDKIEKEMGLDNYLEKTRAYVYDPIVGFKKNKNREIKKGKPVIKSVTDRRVGVKKKKSFVQQNTVKILNDPKTTTFEELQQQLSKVGIEFKYKKDVRNQVGVSFRYKGVAIKGSQIQLKGNLIKKQLEANRDSLNQIEGKRAYEAIINATYKRFDASVKEIINNYKNGIIPDFKEIFSKNDIEFYEESKFLYKNWEFDFKSIKSFERKCNERLVIAKSVLDQDFKNYNAISDQKYKKGIFGILSPEQRKFNEELKSKKEILKYPVLNVKLDSEDFLKQVEDSFQRTYDEIRELKVEHDDVYTTSCDFFEFHEKAPIQKDIRQKSHINLDLLLNQGNAYNEDDEEKKRKRKLKRKRGFKR